jgi:hypothetical protein
MAAGENLHAAWTSKMKSTFYGIGCGSGEKLGSRISDESVRKIRFRVGELQSL